MNEGELSIYTNTETSPDTVEPKWTVYISYGQGLDDALHPGSSPYLREGL